MLEISHLRPQISAASVFNRYDGRIHIEAMIYIWRIFVPFQIGIFSIEIDRVLCVGLQIELYFDVMRSLVALARREMY